MNLSLIFRTTIHLKPIQVLNRLWRKRLALFGGAARPLKRQLPEFTFLNVTGAPCGWNDPQFENLWLYNLHYFDYLRPGSHADLIERWIAENPRGVGNGWEPYPTSLRIVNWVKWLVNHRQGDFGSEVTERMERMESSLVAQVDHLLPRLEYHLLANHLLANAKALVFAGFYFGSLADRVQPKVRRKAAKWLKKGLAIYEKQLPEQTCADGVNFELSPMYHCTILEDLLDCIWLSKFVPSSSPDLFCEYAAKMLAGLKIITGPDGKIAKFNDSTDGIAKSPAELVAYAEKLGVDERCSGKEKERLSDSCSSGFVRLQSGAYTLLVKCGAIGPSYQPGHAHADTFSFELWKGTTKIIGDTGCSTYVPGSIRSYERSTAAHNTVVIGGQNSSEVWASHRVGRRAKVLDLNVTAGSVVGSYRDQFGNIVKRSLALSDNGLSGVDEIVHLAQSQISKFKPNGLHSSDFFDIIFHLPNGVSPDSISIECPGERLVEPCEFADGWNRRVTGTCIRFRQMLQTQSSISWTLKS